jgi:hypothetical protein
MRHHYCGDVLYWLHNLSTQVPYCCGTVFGALQMKENVPITDPVWMVDPNWMSKTGGYVKDMTLRQWYAGLALQEIIHWGFDLDETSDRAHQIADAMLKAREAK